MLLHVLPLLKSCVPKFLFLTIALPFLGCWSMRTSLYYFEEDMQMANKYMKRCSISLVIREMQIKTTMRYDFISTRMTIIKKTDKGIPWWSSGQDSALSLLWPGFIPWSGSYNSASCTVRPKKKSKTDNNKCW